MKVIVADFKKTDIYKKIKQQLEGLDIGILGNVRCFVVFYSFFSEPQGLAVANTVVQGYKMLPLIPSPPHNDDDIEI